MSNTLQLTAKKRPSVGKADARRLRLNHASIPAIVYGAGKDPQSIILDHNMINHALEDDAVYSQVLDLNIDGQVEKVVLKAIQRHVYKPKIMHVDFLRVSAKDKLTMNVQIIYQGEEEAPGVKEGGILSKLVNDVEIRCLPADLPESLEVDMSSLELGASLHLSDIVLPSKVELTSEVTEEHNPPIVSIHQPKAEAVVEEVAEGEEADGEAKPDDAADSAEEKKEE